jgi:hypothetical protein
MGILYNFIVFILGSKPLVYFVDTNLVRDFSQNNVAVYEKRRLFIKYILM